MKCNTNAIMNIQFRGILPIASLAFALATWFPNQVSADELKEAKVTQVIQDVKVLPSDAAPRPAAVNDNVRPGTAVQTGTQSRSELTFKDQTITRLGEKTIFNVGEGARTMDLGSGQFLLYVPKKAGGAKVKMYDEHDTLFYQMLDQGMQTTVPLSQISQNLINAEVAIEDQYFWTDPGIDITGIVRAALADLTHGQVVEGGSTITQQLIKNAIVGNRDTIMRKLQEIILAPEVTRLYSKQEVLSMYLNTIYYGELAYGGDALTHAVQVAGASSVATATPDQFLRALNSLFARSTAAEVCAYVGAAVRARPDLAPEIVVAALRVTSVNPRTDFKDFKQPVGKEISCDEANCIYQAAIAAHPSAAKEIYDAAIAAAPLLRDCFTLPCPLANAPVPPVILAPINPATFVPPVVSPEQPPSGR